VPKPILFLDTNVCIDVANGNISPEDWNRGQRFISANWRYRVSPHTLIELLIKVARGDDACFTKNQSSIRVLASLGGKPTFLPFPGAFAARVLFQKRIHNPDFEPEQLAKWLLVVLRARKKTDLLEGVKLPGRVATFNGLDLARVEGDLQRGKDHHIVRLKRARAAKRPPPSREEWGYLLNSIGGVEAHNDAESVRITDAFDAAYALDRALFEQIRNDSYDLAKHDSDFLDMNQLFYLCDPRVRMVTMEQKLPGRIASSIQRDRVLHFNDLLKLAVVAQEN
jgi:hypothetical protein